MDETEVKVIRQNFEYLVKQGKAEDLLDKLYTLEAIDLDDFQRVCAQVTDSDKMRTLLIILLKKVPSLRVKTFKALVVAFIEAQRTDIANMLESHRQEYIQTPTRLRTQDSAVIGSTQVDSQGFSFRSGDLTSPARIRMVEGMDVADCLPGTTSNRRETTEDGAVANILTELPPPDHSAERLTDLVSVSSKDLRQSIESAKGKLGQIVLGGRVFSYEMKGVFEGGEILWVVSVKDMTTQKCAERKGSEDRHELLQECLLEFVKLKSN